LILGRGWEFFSSTPCPDWLWGPLMLLSNGYCRLFPWGRGVKQLGHKADHLPPFSAKVKECVELHDTSSWCGA